MRTVYCSVGMRKLVLLWEGLADSHLARLGQDELLFVFVFVVADADADAFVVVVVEAGRLPGA